MRSAAPTYTTEPELRDAVLEHCQKEHIQIFGKAYRGNSLAFWNGKLADTQEASRLARALTSTLAEIEVFMTRDPKPHFTVALHLQGVRHLSRGARSEMERLAQFAQEPTAASARTLCLRWMDELEVKAAVPADKRRRAVAKFGTRRITDRELAILSLLSGFFPNVRVDKKHPMTVLEVIRCETRTVREFRMRAKGAR